MDRNYYDLGKVASSRMHDLHAQADYDAMVDEAKANRQPSRFQQKIGHLIMAIGARLAGEPVLKTQTN